MMRVLVTGGAGFIGSAVCRRLVQTTDAHVTNLDKLTYAGSLASLRAIEHDPRYRFVQADICDAAALADTFAAAQPDAVIHLAAETHVDRSVTGAADFIATNVVGSYQILEAARRYWSALPPSRADAFRFLHVSTDEVYGSLGSAGLFSETSRYDPSSPYSASKASSDHLAIAWRRTYGLPVLVSHCSNNYGPHQFPEKLIPLVILNALEGRELPVYGDGSNVRDWLHVEDHARALQLICAKGRVGETYNVGGRNERTNLEVVKAICRELDTLKPGPEPREKLIRFVPDRPGHDHRYALDATKLETELGWRAKKTFGTGLAETVRWYVENEWWWRPLRDRVYFGERLGLAVAAQG